MLINLVTYQSSNFVILCDNNEAAIIKLHTDKLRPVVVYLYSNL